jgi:hypothetical protein
LVGQSEAGRREVVIGIEAKAAETFGELVGTEYDRASRRQGSHLPERITSLAKAIFGRGPEEIREVRYQLVYGLAGTIIEASKRHASLAVFIVHQFLTAHCTKAVLSRNDGDWQRFVGLLPLTRPAGADTEALLGPFTVPGDGRVSDCVRVLIGKATTRTDL